MKATVPLAATLFLAAPLAFSTTPARAQAQPADSCGTSSGLCWPRLKRGVRGYQTQALQNLLLARGYKIGADGVFGASTQTALRTYQKTHGLRADGVAGWQTWESIAPNLERGSRGRAVLALQTLLKMKNIPLRSDGVYGADTEKGVKQYQGAYGFSPLDGRVTKHMWCQLVGGTAPGDD